MKKHRYTNKNMKTEQLPMAFMAVVVAGTMSASAQSTLIYDGVNPGENVDLQVTGAITYGKNIPAGINNLTIDGLAVPSFCIDVSRRVSDGQTFADYSYADLTVAPLAPAGPMGSSAATDIEKLWAAYYPAATMNNQDAAALQTAIWLEVGDSVGTYTVTVNGNNVSDPVYSEALGMLNNLPNLTAEANLTGLVSPTGQNWVVLTPVPEPAAAGCLLLGLGVWAGFKRLKTGRQNNS
jgi:hypothetical protein